MVSLMIDLQEKAFTASSMVIHCTQVIPFSSPNIFLCLNIFFLVTICIDSIVCTTAE